ncbi:SMI1/KNR4 family protein [Inquilinus sp. Marseille-Q2685]|uniref:SMI1/KNR4 family protein n=1 Tax=Inquilinus sp. Marseille-Q2685 TaxID=2866581 RepID=UPI001CE3D85C|nr:SMI1/KNR4 family protein [Inquilinus sp. Marseille-Q2685]
MSAVDTTIQLILDSGESYRPGSGATDDMLFAFEGRLGVKFPPSYRHFLARMGTLSFMGHQFYGITKSGLNAQSIPCVLWATERSREKGHITDSMLRIKMSGHGPFYVIDLSQTDAEGEGPVLELPVQGISGGSEKIADDFGSFFLDEITSALADR